MRQVAEARGNAHARHAPRPELWPSLRETRKARRSRLLLVDDHVVVRDGLEALLGLESDLEISGSVGSVAAACEFLEHSPVELVICDLNLPDVSGGQAVKTLHDRASGIAMLVLSAHDSLEYVRAAFIGGALGYVCKDAPRSELLRAIRRVLANRHCVCGAVCEAVMADWLEHFQSPERQARAQLDEQAARVVRMIALGVPSWRIAEDLGRGIKAVEKYRTALMKRLGLSSAALVTRFAIEHELVNSLELDHLLEEQ